MSHHSKKCVEKPLRKEQGCVASSKQLAREQRSSHEHACISSSFSMIHEVNESPSMHALTFNSSPNIKKHATKKQRNDANTTTTPTTVSSSNPFDGSYSFSSYLNLPVSKEFTGRGENTSSLTRVNDASSSEHLQGKRGRKFKIPPEFQPSMLERTRAAQATCVSNDHACNVSTRSIAISSMHARTHDACIAKPHKMKLVLRQHPHEDGTMNFAAKSSSSMHAWTALTPSSSIQSQQPVNVSHHSHATSTMRETLSEECRVKSKLAMFFGFVMGMMKMHEVKTHSILTLEKKNNLAEMSGKNEQEKTRSEELLESRYSLEKNGNDSNLREQGKGLQQHETIENGESLQRTAPVRTSISIQELLNH